MMLCRIKEDFKNLFSVKNDHFQPIDGLRSITCFMIVAVHLITLLNIFIPPLPHSEWLVYRKSLSFTLIFLLSLTLDTFFLLSGFSLTYKYLHQWKRMPTLLEFIKDYPVYIFRRACRFGPGFLLISIIMWIFSEPYGNYWSMWFFHQNYISMNDWSIGMGPLWSVSLDMQIHVILPFLLYSIVSYRRFISFETSVSILILLSIIYSLLTFDPNTMNMMKVSTRCSSLSLLMRERIGHWIELNWITMYRSLW